ncbi:hypothetical protein [Phenylobacterium deserti]|uniref:Uncharacterized protein n=1 Tax=Phenylobacterium deserti TaxID=1914756 RepID=A0A328ABV9_9CAUL|nr:hypothetical protein [Phenylobacterium deserti]RAK52130.1 hypothetical protein DJ018_13320 [Phenylobacterium deserti]
MATSGTTSSTLTVREVIDLACEELGILAMGDTLDATVAERAMTRLNWMLKTWQADGLTNGWRIEDVSITWPADTATATLDTNYLDLENVRRSISGIETPLERFDADEYAQLPNKAATGVPNSYVVKKTRDTLSVSLWPVPTAETTILADGARIIEDVTDLGQNIDVPQEWLETVYMCLAARLITPFKSLMTDPASAKAVEERAATLYARLKTFGDESGSIYFQTA